MDDELDPPRKFYEFKPREFEVVNKLRPTAPTENTSPPRATDPDRKIEISELYRQAAVPGAVLNRTSDTAKNEVHAILEDNVARANAAGLNNLAPKPKRRL